MYWDCQYTEVVETLRTLGLRRTLQTIYMGELYRNVKILMAKISDINLFILIGF